MNQLDRIQSQIFGAPQETAAPANDRLSKISGQIFGEDQESSPGGDMDDQTKELLAKLDSLGKPVSGYGASIGEGTKDLARNTLEFARGVELGTDTGAAAERFEASQKKPQKGAGPLSMLNTPGQAAEMAEAKSLGVDPKKALDVNRDERVKGYEAEIERWAADPDYNPGEGFRKFTHDVVRMTPQVAAQVAASLAAGPAGGMAFMAPQIAGGQMAQLEQDGVKDPERRLKAAMINAAGQVPLEQLAMGKMLSVWKPTSGALRVIRDLGAGTATEFGTEFVQKVLPEHATTVWAKTEGMPMSDRWNIYWESLPQAAKEGAYEGAVAMVPGAGFAGAKVYVDRAQYKKDNPGEDLDAIIAKYKKDPTTADAAPTPGAGSGDLASAVGARSDRQPASPAKDALQVLDAGENLSRGIVHSQLTKNKLTQEATAKERAAVETKATEFARKQKAAQDKLLRAEAQVSQEINNQRALQAENLQEYQNLQTQRLENDHMKAARMANEQWMQAFEHPQMQPQVVNGLISDLENAKDQKNEYGEVVAKPLMSQFDTHESNMVGGMLRRAHKAATLGNTTVAQVDEILYDLNSSAGLIKSDPKTQAVLELLQDQLTGMRADLAAQEAANEMAKASTQKSVQSTVEKFKARHMPEPPVDMGPPKSPYQPKTGQVIGATAPRVAGKVIADPTARPNPDAKIEVATALRPVDKTAGKHALDQELVDKIDAASRVTPGPAKPASQSAIAFLEEGTSKTDEDVKTGRQKQMADRQRVKDVDNLSKTEIVPKSAKDSAEVLGQAGTDLVSRMKAYRAKTVKEKAVPSKTDKEALTERMRPWKIYTNEDSAKRAQRKFGLNETHKVVPYGDRFRIVPVDEKVDQNEKVLPEQKTGTPNPEVKTPAKPDQKTTGKLSEKVKQWMREIKEEDDKAEAPAKALRAKSTPAKAKVTSPAPPGKAIEDKPRSQVTPEPKSSPAVAEALVEDEAAEKHKQAVSFAKELTEIQKKVKKGTAGAKEVSRIQAILGEDASPRTDADLQKMVDDYKRQNKVADEELATAETMQERLKKFQANLPEDQRASKAPAGAKGVQQKLIKDAIKPLVDLSSTRALKTAVVDTQDQLPDHLQASLGDGKIEAVWDPKTKKVYMVAENIGSTQRAVEVWLHEQVGHHGLMKLFDDHGADFETFLEVAYNTVRKSTRAFEQVQKEYAADLAKLSPEAQKRLIVEEFLARRAEALNPAVRKNMFDRFLTFINKWLRKLLGDLPGNPSLTMKDLDTLLETAKNRLFFGDSRDWLEFKHTDQEYKNWCKELWEVNPSAVTWYENHIQLVEEIFGKDAALFNILLGLTSPQAGVFTNAQWAVDTYLYLQGVADKAGGKYPSNVAKTIERILNGDLTFSDQYKVDEFVRGLTGDYKSTTNDLWMHRALFGRALLTRARIEAIYASDGRRRIYDYKVKNKLINPKAVKKPATSSLKDLDSLFTMPENTSSRHKIFQIAKELTEETGRPWSPREVQASIWMKVKAVAEKRDLSEFVYDYGWALDKYRSPEPKKNKSGKYPKGTEWKHGGMTPIEYLRANLPEEKIGTLTQKYGLPEKLYEPVSKLEKAYLQYLKNKGVEQLDRYSTDIEDKTLIHYRSTVQKEARGLGLTETPPAYSHNDVGKRQEQHSEKHPYVPYSYWYGPDSKPEAGLISKKPHQTKIGKLRVYNGRYDALGLWDKAQKEVSAAHKKQIPAHIGNVFAQLVKDEGFDGFSINRNNQGDWYALFEPKELAPPLETTIRLSEVVEGIEDMPQEADALARMAADRGPALRAEVERELKDKYPSVRVKRSQNSIARFGSEGAGATSGKMEYGLTMELEGPLNAIRAAMSDIIGLGKSQRMVFVEYDPAMVDEASDGTLGRRFKFTVKPGMTPAQIQEKIDKAGIRDYNLTSDGRSHFLDMFLGPWVTDNEIAQFKQLKDAIGSPGSLDTHETYSDALGDVEHDGTNWEKAHKSYRKHLVNFFGETIGNERFADGQKAGANYEQTVAALGGVARVQGPDGRGPGSTPPRGNRENLPEPAKEQGREARARETVTEEALPEEPPEHFTDAQKQWYRQGMIDTEGNPRYSRKVPADLRALEKYAGKIKTTRSAVEAVKAVLMGDWKSYWDSFISGAVDHLNPLKTLEKGLNLGPLSAYRSFRLMSTLPNIFGTLLHDGHLQYDPQSHWVTVDRSRINGGMMGAVERLGPSAEYWKYWMLGESVRELIKRRGLGHDSVQHFFGKDPATGQWIDPTAALADMNALTAPHRTPEWDRARQTFAEFNASMLDFGVKSGILNKEGVELWKRETYLPANRMMERWGTSGDRTGTPFNQQKHVGGVKELKGGAHHIGDPLENLLANYAHLLEEGLKNISRLKAYGILQGTSFFGPGQVTDPNSIAIKVDGIAKYYRVEDEAVYKALVEVDQPWLTQWVKWAGYPKRLITAGITLTPAFRIANMIRDTLATWVMQGDVKTFLQAGKNFWGAWKNSADMIELRAAGGAFSGSFAKADNALQFANVINSALNKQELHPLNPKRAAKFWEQLGTAAENAARLGLYRRERAEGSTISEAAFKSKDLMDFSMHGSLSFVRALTGIVPFLNARAQGLYKLGRTAVSPETRKGFALRGATLAGLSLGLAAINQAMVPDEWDELPDEDRWLYFHFWLPEELGGHVRMPMPFEVGAIFGALPIMGAEFLRKESPEAWEDMSRFIGFTLKQTFALDPLAPIRPMSEVKHNRSEFTGRPIVGMAQEGADPGDQYDPWTSKTLQKIGEWVPKHFSPKKAEHLLSQYLHGYWDMASAVTDNIMIPLMADYPEDPSLTREDYWVTSRFLRNERPRHTKYEREFYEMLDEADQAFRSFSLRKQRGDVDGSLDYLKEHWTEIERSKVLGKYSDVLSTLRTHERLIYRSSKSAEIKRLELDRLAEKRHDLFRRAIKEIKNGD